MYVHNNVSFVPLCAASLSLLEGGANGLDDTATQFAEVQVFGGSLKEYKQTNINDVSVCHLLFF